MDLFGAKKTQEKLEAAADAVISGKKELSDALDAIRKEAEKTVEDVKTKAAEMQKKVETAAKVEAVVETIKCVSLIGILAGVITIAVKK